jgi:hypothetical protein
MDAYNNDSAATTGMSRTETPKTKRTMKLPRVKFYVAHSHMEAFPVHPIHLQAANTIPISCHPPPLSHAQLTPHAAVLDQDSTNHLEKKSAQKYIPTRSRDPTTGH